MSANPPLEGQHHGLHGDVAIPNPAAATTTLTIPSSNVSIGILLAAQQRTDRFASITSRLWLADGWWRPRG